MHLESLRASFFVLTQLSWKGIVVPQGKTFFDICKLFSVLFIFIFLDNVQYKKCTTGLMWTFFYNALDVHAIGWVIIDPYES